MDNNNLKNNKKSLGIIIALAAAIVLGVAVLVIAIVSVVSSSNDNKPVTVTEGTSQYTLANVTEPSTQESKADLTDLLPVSSEVSVAEPTVNQTQTPVNNITEESVQAGDVVVPTTAKPTDVAYDPVEEYENLSKNGDNVLSDYHGNKFIKLVSEKYNVDANLLVAIYSEPDTGNNFVLEFSGKTNSDGDIIKSPDTLEKVYLIDKQQNISVATGKTKGNVGVSYAEGTLCFYMMKSVVMPQYPDYFTGV